MAPLVIINQCKFYKRVKLYFSFFFHFPHCQADRIFMVLKYENMHWRVHKTKPKTEKSYQKIFLKQNLNWRPPSRPDWREDHYTVATPMISRKFAFEQFSFSTFFVVWLLSGLRKEFIFVQIPLGLAVYLQSCKENLQEG